MFRTPTRPGFRDSKCAHGSACSRRRKRRQAIIDRLSREIKKASTDPKFVAALAPQGMQIIASSPDEMAQAMREDFKKWGDVIRETGTTINQ